MALDTPSLDDSHDFGIQLFRVLLSDLDVSQESHNWKWLRAIAGAVFGNHAHINAVENDVMPDTATGDMADRWGNIRGVGRKGATTSFGSKVLRFNGTPGAPIPDQTALVHTPTQLQFKTSGTQTIGATGFVDVDVASIDTGSKTRLNAGEVLTLEQGISGVQDDAELQANIDQGGTDAEIDGDYVPRYLKRFKNPPLGGTAANFEDQATTQAGIAQAFCYPLRNGFGTVDLAALHAGSGSLRVLTPTEVSTLQTALNALRPVAMKGFRVLTVTTQTQNVEVTIVDDGSIAHVFDWDDTTPPTCLSWNATTRILQFAGGSRPATMQPNDRVTFSDGATGAERVIEALSGADSVILTVDVTGDTPNPTTTTVYSGGPLVAPARAAIQALFDSLGTANPDTHRYGAWEGNLRPNAIGRVLTSVPGVLDLGTLVTPSSTVVASDPAFPNNGTVGLLVAGRILVRKAH